MSGFWHPLSAVYLAEPRILASPAVLRLMMSAGSAEVVYGGDRMWPAIRHGQALTVAPVAGSSPIAGDVILTLDDGILDVVRVAGSANVMTVIADADASPPRPASSRDCLGRIDPPPRRRRWNGVIVRMWLDLREAVGAGPDGDPAGSVLEKYDAQAVHYERPGTAALEPGLSSRIQERVPRGARVLVAGSGVGREAFALAEAGFDVVGVDFSARMVEAARKEATRRGSNVTFACSDLRVHEEPVASLGAVVFTYDVYSFVPVRRDREELLLRVRRWLAPGGTVFLSARRTRGLWDRTVLSTQWLTRRGRGAWGDSHTRWLDSSGTLRRSFVHVFTDRRLERETRAAQLCRVSWEGGHGMYEARA